MIDRRASCSFDNGGDGEHNYVSFVEISILFVTPDDLYHTKHHNSAEYLTLCNLERPSSTMAISSMVSLGDISPIVVVVRTEPTLRCFMH